ncbi:MAG: TrkA C-terminal domain-containing protein [Desulfobacterales bacterium]|jgi:putative transport protein
MMGQTILAFFQLHPVFNLFLILGAGLVVGKFRIKGTEIGSVTGVLFIGIIAGHFNLPIPTASHSIGFILFIYCVGFQAGPRFLGAFKQDGGRYVLLALITAGSAAALTVVISHAFELEQGYASGILAGALTSTPTLVAARDALDQGVRIAGGLTQQGVVANLSASYAITYVFGLSGLILFINFIPAIFRIDLVKKAHQLTELSWIRSRQDTAEAMKIKETPTVRTYHVDREQIVDREMDDKVYGLAAAVPRIRRDGEVFTPDYDTRLQLGDIVAVVAKHSAHKRIAEMLGPEIFDQELLDRSIETMSIVLSNKSFEGKSLAEMNFARNYHCSLTRLTRGGVDLPRRPDLKLSRGDILVLTGNATQLKDLARQLGFEESRWKETDLVSFAFGIALGLLMGIPSISLGGIKIGLGSAGGVLASGIIFGLLNSRYVVVGRLPAAARYVIMELGMMLFISSVAVSAGTDIMDTFQDAGLKLLLAGAAVTLIPVLICFLVGCYLMRMNVALLLGAIAGSMTSTAALQQINNRAKSTLPTLGYVGSYAFANVLLAIAGSVIVRV